MGSCSLPLLFNSAYINGKWVQANSGNVFEVLNPATLEVIASVPDMCVVDVEAAIFAARDAFKTWSTTTAKVSMKFLSTYSLILYTD